MKKLDKEKLYKITDEIANNIFRDYWEWFYDVDKKQHEEDVYYLLDVIASLHNLLYEQVTGERYDYMWHWANKAGGDVKDDIFDEQEDKEKGE